MKRRAIQWLILCSGLAVHVALVLRQYPFRVFLAGDIPLKGDVGRYFATAYGAARAGGVWGYDPSCMAGYPVGLWNSMGKKGFEVFHWLFPLLPLPALFYLVITGLSLLCPLMLWLALRRACPTPRSARILLGVSLIYWHLSTRIAYFWGSGNVFFPAAACMIVPAAVLLAGLRESRRPLPRAVFLGLCGAAIFYFHTVVWIAAAVPFLALLMRRHTATGGSSAAGSDAPSRAVSLVFLLAVACLVCAGLCAWWFVPLMQTASDCVSQPKAWFQGGPKDLIMDFFSDRAYQHPFDRNFLYHAAIVLGLAGTWLCRRHRRAPVVEALGLGAVAALAIAYGATYIKAFAAIQPYRFVIPATILLLAPMSVAIDEGIAVLAAAPPKTKAVVFALLLVMAPELTAYLVDLTWPPEPCGLTTQRREIVDELRGLPVRGRILCDDSGLGHVLPYFRDVPVIGGLSSQAFLKHRFAGMDDDGILFGRPASRWNAGELTRHLKAYAVEYAIFSTADWVRLARRPESPFEFVKTIGGQHLFRVRDADPSFVLEGAGRATADGRGIRVSDATGGELTLKFHYAEWLVADRGVRLEPVAALDDPVPFIKAIVPPGVDRFAIVKR